MKIPKKVKLGGHNYKVKFTVNTGLNEENCADISRKTDTIYINSSLTKSQQEVSFFHEVLHGINNELSEVTIDSLAEQLYAFLKNNKII